MTIEVTGAVTYAVHWGGVQGGDGMDGQLTRCRLSNGVIVYVRENMAARDMVSVSSGERRAMKQGNGVRSRDVLELCCPAELWDAVAALVADLDPMRRSVRRNRNFTRQWAERKFCDE